MASPAVERLDRLAALDGYRIREAGGELQRRAWSGHLGIFRGEAFQFASDDHYQIRAWLAANAPRNSI